MSVSRRLSRKERMNSVAPEWEPSPWDSGEIEAEKQQAGYDLRTDWPIVWTAIWLPDLSDGLFGQPRDWFARNDVSWHAQYAGEDLVLSENAWSGWPDAPRYGFASRESSRGDLPWKPWGCFDTLPEKWMFLERADQHAQDR
jgi:hypothetical protein